jgi:hypothetical protein
MDQSKNTSRLTGNSSKITPVTESKGKKVHRLGGKKVEPKAKDKEKSSSEGSTSESENERQKTVVTATPRSTARVKQKSESSEESSSEMEEEEENGEKMLGPPSLHSTAQVKQKSESSSEESSSEGDEDQTQTATKTQANSHGAEGDKKTVQRVEETDSSEADTGNESEDQASQSLFDTCTQQSLESDCGAEKSGADGKNQNFKPLAVLPAAADLLKSGPKSYVGNDATAKGKSDNGTSSDEGVDEEETTTLPVKAGLEKTRFLKKIQPRGFLCFFCFFGSFGFFSFKNTFRCIQTLNYNHSY